MKFSIFTALAAVGSVTAANQAIVINDCATDIYVQSHPPNDGAPGPLQALKPGQRFTEDLRSTGSTIKISDKRTLDKPLFFGYSSTSKPAAVFYELSNAFGNPFAAKRNILNPGAGCEKFDCAANDAKCYSNPPAKRNIVHNCPSPTNLYARICAK